MSGKFDVYDTYRQFDEAYDKTRQRAYTCEKFYVAYDHIYFDMGVSYGGRRHRTLKCGEPFSHSTDNKGSTIDTWFTERIKD